MVYNGKHHRNPSGHNNRVKWLLSMCNWNSAHLGDVFQYIKDPTPQGDSAAHFAWKNRWVEAYKEAQLWIKIGGRYYREVVRLRDGNKRALLRIADMQHELSKYDGMCAKCERGQDEHRNKRFITTCQYDIENTCTLPYQCPLYNECHIGYTNTNKMSTDLLKEAGQNDKQ